MRFGVKFLSSEDGWVNAEIPRLGDVTQGKNLEEARDMARDAVLNALIWEWQNGREVSSDAALQEGCEWLQIPTRALVAAKVTLLREMRRLTMREVAERLGVSIGTYQRWENAKTCNAGIDTLERIGHALGKELEIAFR